MGCSSLYNLSPKEQAFSWASGIKMLTQQQQLEWSLMQVPAKVSLAKHRQAQTHVANWATAASENLSTVSHPRRSNDKVIQATSRRFANRSDCGFDSPARPGQIQAPGTVVFLDSSSLLRSRATFEIGFISPVTCKYCCPWPLRRTRDFKQYVSCLNLPLIVSEQPVHFYSNKREKANPAGSGQPAHFYKKRRGRASLSGSEQPIHFYKKRRGESQSDCLRTTNPLL